MKNMTVICSCGIKVSLINVGDDYTGDGFKCKYCEAEELLLNNDPRPDSKRKYRHKES